MRRGGRPLAEGMIVGGAGPRRVRPASPATFGPRRPPCRGHEGAGHAAWSEARSIARSVVPLLWARSLILRGLQPPRTCSAPRVPAERARKVPAVVQPGRWGRSHRTERPTRSSTAHLRLCARTNVPMLSHSFSAWAHHRTQRRRLPSVVYTCVLYRSSSGRTEKFRAEGGHRTRGRSPRGRSSSSRLVVRLAPRLRLGPRSSPRPRLPRRRAPTRARNPAALCGRSARSALGLEGIDRFLYRQVLAWRGGAAGLLDSTCSALPSRPDHRRGSRTAWAPLVAPRHLGLPLDSTASASSRRRIAVPPPISSPDLCRTSAPLSAAVGQGTTSRAGRRAPAGVPPPLFVSLRYQRSPRTYFFGWAPLSAADHTASSSRTCASSWWVALQRPSLASPPRRALAPLDRAQVRIPTCRHAGPIHGCRCPRTGDGRLPPLTARRSLTS